MLPSDEQADFVFRAQLYVRVFGAASDDLRACICCPSNHVDLTVTPYASHEQRRMSVGPQEFGIRLR